uniref:Serine-threonine/tyrosine-protein kinase catalytic domain-containing protein n=1 Tax=Cyanistes caeruleus TaxID=156563 RepID=A0A8C0V127_CYACU
RMSPEPQPQHQHTTDLPQDNPSSLPFPQVNQGNMPGIQSTFLAMDTEEGVEVVWNELLFTDKKAFKAHEEKIKTMFEQLVLVDHPNIVKLHKYWLDVKDSKARVIFITEYVSSGSLKQFLKKTKKNHKAMNARVSPGSTTGVPAGAGGSVSPSQGGSLGSYRAEQVGVTVPRVTWGPCWTPGEPQLDPTGPKVGVAAVGGTAPGVTILGVLPLPRAGTWGQGTTITCKAQGCEGPVG